MLPVETNALTLLLNCLNSGIGYYHAEKLLSQFLADDILASELATAREQAYNAYNANVGDYVKDVQIAFHIRKAAELNQLIEELKK